MKIAYYPPENLTQKQFDELTTKMKSIHSEWSNLEKAWIIYDSAEMLSKFILTLPR